MRAATLPEPKSPVALVPLAARHPVASQLDALPSPEEALQQVLAKQPFQDHSIQANPSGMLTNLLRHTNLNAGGSDDAPIRQSSASVTGLLPVGPGADILHTPVSTPRISTIIPTPQPPTPSPCAFTSASASSNSLQRHFASRARQGGKPAAALALELLHLVNRGERIPGAVQDATLAQQEVVGQSQPNATPLPATNTWATSPFAWQPLHKDSFLAFQEGLNRDSSRHGNSSEGFPTDGFAKDTSGVLDGFQSSDSDGRGSRTNSVNGEHHHTCHKKDGYADQDLQENSCVYSNVAQNRDRLGAGGRRILAQDNLAFDDYSGDSSFKDKLMQHRVAANSYRHGNGHHYKCHSKGLDAHKHDGRKHSSYEHDGYRHKEDSYHGHSQEQPCSWPQYEPKSCKHNSNQHVSHSQKQEDHYCLGGNCMNSTSHSKDCHCGECLAKQTSRDNSFGLDGVLKDDLPGKDRGNNMTAERPGESRQVNSNVIKEGRHEHAHSKRVGHDLRGSHGDDSGPHNHNTMSHDSSDRPRPSTRLSRADRKNSNSGELIDGFLRDGGFATGWISSDKGSNHERKAHKTQLSRARQSYLRRSPSNPAPLRQNSLEGGAHTKRDHSRDALSVHKGVNNDYSWDGGSKQTPCKPRTGTCSFLVGSLSANIPSVKVSQRQHRGTLVAHATAEPEYHNNSENNQQCNRDVSDEPEDNKHRVSLDGHLKEGSMTDSRNRHSVMSYGQMRHEAQPWSDLSRAHQHLVSSSQGAKYYMDRSILSREAAQQRLKLQSTSYPNESDLDRMLRTSAAQQCKKRGRRDTSPLPSNFMYNSSGNPAVNFGSTQANSALGGRTHWTQLSNDQLSDSADVKVPQCTNPSRANLMQQLPTPFQTPGPPFEECASPKKHHSDPLPLPFWARAEHGMQHALAPTQGQADEVKVQAFRSPQHSPSSRRSKKPCHLTQIYTSMSSSF